LALSSASWFGFWKSVTTPCEVINPAVIRAAAGWGRKWESTWKLTYQSNHVHHCRVTSYEQQECDLDDVGLLDMTRFQLFHNYLADKIVRGLYHALINKLGEVVEQLSFATGSSEFEFCPLRKWCGPDAYWLADAASRAVALPLVRTAFCCVKYSRSSTGTPRI